jgi:putative glutamine amidotransferase
MNLPLIGITSGREQTKSGSTHIGALESYIKAIRNANGIPLLIPLGIPESFLDIFIQLSDGILFTGGGDIHPNTYGGENLPSVSSIDKNRDRVELYIFKRIFESRKPFLGICRGIQLAKVALGGTLYEDINSQLPNSLQHQNFPKI